MTLNSQVLATLFDLDQQMEAEGWDLGTGVWGLHAHSEGGEDITPMKLFGPEYADMHPLDVLGQITVPPPPCTVGLAIGYECWVTSDPDLTVQDDPNRIETRFTVAALRTGMWVVVHRARGEKPRGFILNGMRILTVNSGLFRVAQVLMAILEEAPPDIPPSLLSLLQALGINPSQVEIIDLGSLGDEEQ